MIILFFALSLLSFVSFPGTVFKLNFTNRLFSLQILCLVTLHYYCFHVTFIMTVTRKGEKERKTGTGYTINCFSDGGSGVTRLIMGVEVLVSRVN